MNAGGPYRVPGVRPTHENDLGELQQASGEWLDRLIDAWIGLSRNHGETDVDYRARALRHVSTKFWKASGAEPEPDPFAKENDVLESERWKEVARSWRRRFLVGVSGWKKQAKWLAEKVASLERDLVEMHEADDAESEELELAKQDAEASRKKLEHQNRRVSEYEYAKNRAEDRARELERDVERLARRVREMEASYAAQMSEIGTLRRSLEETNRREVMPARARLRVLATRLGFDPDVPGYASDDWLTDRIDRVLVRLLKETANVANVRVMVEEEVASKVGDPTPRNIAIR